MKGATALCLLLAGACLPAAADTQAWARHFYGNTTAREASPAGGAPSPYGQGALARGGDDSVYAVGRGHNGANYDWKVVKVGRNGSVHWETMFDGGSGDDAAIAVKVDVNGNAFVSGWVRNAAGNDDLKVVRFNNFTGAVAWQYTFAGTGNGTDRAASIDLDPSGDVLVAGTILQPNKEWYVAKLSGATGAMAWQATYGTGLGDDTAVAVVADANGHAAVAGTTRNARGFQDSRVVSFNGATGAVRWTWNHPNSNDFDDVVHGLAISRSFSGDLLVYGAHHDSEVYTAHASQLSASTGARAWVRGLTNIDQAYYMSASESGSGWVVAGFTGTFANDAYIVERLAGDTGVPSWSHTYGAPNRHEQAWAVHDSGFSTVATGFTVDGTQDVATIRLNQSSGASQSTAVHAGSFGGADAGHAVLTDFEGGTVVLASTREASKPFGMSVLRYFPGAALAKAITLSGPAGAQSTLGPFTYSIQAPAGSTGNATIRRNGAVACEFILSNGAGSCQLSLVPHVENRIFGEFNEGGAPVFTADTLVTPPATVDIHVQLGGVGVITSQPAGIDCPNNLCSASFVPAQFPVTLTAVPPAGSYFEGWGGACTGTQSTCVLSPSPSVQTASGSFQVRHMVLEGATTRAFANTVLGQSNSQMILRVRNVHTGVIGLESIVIGGDHPGDFTIDPVCGLPGLIQPSLYCSLRPVFTPTAAGLRTATLTIYSSQSTAPPLVVTLTGNAFAYPDTTITSVPANDSGHDFGAFSFTSSIPGATFQCAIDGGAPVACVSPHTFTNVPVGSHTVTVTAVNGGVAFDPTPASHAWTTVNPYPIATLSKTHVEFGVKLPGSTYFDSVEVGNAGTAPLQISGYFLNTGEGIFAISPTSTCAQSMELAVGQICHIGVLYMPQPFEITVGMHINTPFNPAGHIGFTVHGIGAAIPDTGILSGPAGATRSTTASFTSEASLNYATFECKLEPPVEAYADCAGGAFTRNNLAPGAYTFSVRARTIAGPDPSPATRSFTVVAGGVDLPDFNGDGKPDLVWSNTANGNTYAWYMNGPALIADAFIAGIDPSWKVQGVADFNGDGKPDLVWRNTANGNTYVWYMNGAAFVSDAFVFSLPPEWVIQGVADFNADGKPDFLMRNASSGNAFAWFFNDNVAVGDQFLFNIDPSWKVEGVGDLNADNQPDLFFRNSVSGLAFAWYSTWSGGTLALAGSTPPIFSIDPAWEIVQVADWNADGSPDLVFRNTASGVVFVWYMTGTTLTTSDFIIQIDPSWEIVPRR